MTSPAQTDPVMTDPAQTDPATDSAASESGLPRPGRRVRKQHVPSQAHGWQRSGDQSAPAELAAASGRRRNTPAGTSLLLTLIVGVLTAIGIARVHATTRVLELGAEITSLTAEQASLLDTRRRLAAERAYLRHPSHIDEVARHQLQMIPMSPDLVQTIRLHEQTPPQEPTP